MTCKRALPTAGNSNTVPFARAANRPNFGSVPAGARKPEAKTTAAPPPKVPKLAAKEATTVLLPAGVTSKT